MNNKNSDYKKSGVDIDEGNRFISLIKESVNSTKIPGVMGGIGGFAGFFDLAAFAGMKEPVLVSGTDGVGTKLKIAIDSGVYNTVGIDLVAMSVNDLAVTGAKPLFFLDYLATGKLLPEKMCQVVEGVTAGCRDAGCALLGGETAEMPGMYHNDDFDLAGFAVGIVDKSKIIDGSSIKEGDAIIGVSSSGFHSNGYSLLRNILFNELKLQLNSPFITGKTVAEALLTPTKIYVRLVQEVISKVNVKGMVHITGGGFYDNIPRVLPGGLDVTIDKSKIIQPDIIKKFVEITDIDERELYRVLNMGIGYIFAVDKADKDKTLDIIRKFGDTACELGVVTKGSRVVRILGIDA